MSSARLIFYFRIAPALFIAGLLISGISAFPLRWELDCLASWVGVGASPDLTSLRGIPLYWRFIDCSFNVFDIIPLIYCLAISRKLKRISAQLGAAANGIPLLQ